MQACGWKEVRVATTAHLQGSKGHCENNSGCSAHWTMIPSSIFVTGNGITQQRGNEAKLIEPHNYFTKIKHPQL